MHSECLQDVPAATDFIWTHVCGSGGSVNMYLNHEIYLEISGGRNKDDHMHSSTFAFFLRWVGILNSRSWNFEFPTPRVPRIPKGPPSRGQPSSWPDAFSSRFWRRRRAKFCWALRRSSRPTTWRHLSLPVLRSFWSLPQKSAVLRTTWTTGNLLFELQLPITEVWPKMDAIIESYERFEIQKLPLFGEHFVSIMTIIVF